MAHDEFVAVLGGFQGLRVNLRRYGGAKRSILRRGGRVREIRVYANRREGEQEGVIVS